MPTQRATRLRAPAACSAARGTSPTRSSSPDAAYRSARTQPMRLEIKNPARGGRPFSARNDRRLRERLFFQIEQQRQSALDLEPFVDRVEMILDRSLGYAEPLRQFFIAQSAYRCARDLDLSSREYVQRLPI